MPSEAPVPEHVARCRKCKAIIPWDETIRVSQEPPDGKTLTQYSFCASCGVTLPFPSQPVLRRVAEVRIRASVR